MSEPLEFRFPPDPSHLRILRKAVRDGVLELGVIERSVDLLVLAMDEIVSNSIEHGEADREGDNMLCVRVELQGGDLRFDFFDPGVPDETVEKMSTWLANSQNGLPDLESERGRGFFLMSSSLDEILIQPAEEGGMHMLGRMIGVID